MDNQITSLDDLWLRQAQLNAKAGFDTLSLGRRLAEVEAGGAMSEQLSIRLEAGKALKCYIDALASECHELMDCLSWKHWYKEARQGRQYELRDLQNAKVEVIDILFFWVSLCQLLGLEPTDVYRLYAKKLDINLRRQAEDRTQADHSSFEDENRTVT
jgi:hypothetical protein